MIYGSRMWRSTVKKPFFQKESFTKETLYVIDKESGVAWRWFA